MSRRDKNPAFRELYSRGGAHSKQQSRSIGSVSEEGKSRGEGTQRGGVGRRVFTVPCQEVSLGGGF